LPQQYYISSAILSGFEDSCSVLGADDGNGGAGCIANKQATGPVCLTATQVNIKGIFWMSSPCPTTADNILITNPQQCKSTQYADIYYIALPGEQPKPYSINATRRFDQVDAVNWSTRSFKTKKLTVVQEIITQHGSGLDEAQLAAISR